MSVATTGGGRRHGRSIAATIAVSVVGAACTPSTGPVDRAEQLDRSPIEIDLTAVPQEIDRRLFGTNVPAWILPETMADADFRDEIVASGTTVLRMPGGSWSNDYDWLGCELDDEAACFATWASKPSDFVDLLNATGLAGMWTVAFNDTAQSAAAAVAFFNGEVGDHTRIGIDRHGIDWETVDHWASLRAAHGHRPPVDVELWEIGNEIFGARPESGGSECASFGWENVWTCDGTEYVTGDADHDGFLDFRRAMHAVDPDILIGAVGVADAESWGGWGREVIDAAGDELDFYVLHDYGFDSSPEPEEALRRPGDDWPSLIGSTRALVASDVPIAVTEYNLVSFEAGDTRQTMTTALNALYLGETLGQLAMHGVPIANQWNLANGVTESGTDYGMISLDDGRRLPQFYAIEAWTRAGSRLYPVQRETDGLRLYPTQHPDGRLTLIALNVSDAPLDEKLALNGGPAAATATLHTVHADGPSASTMSRAPAETTAVADGRVALTLPPWSITRVEIGADVD